jgi:hypothetical protein
MINVTYYYVEGIVKMTIHSNFNIQKDKNDRNYERQIFQTSTNVYRMSESVLGDFIAKMIMKDLRKFIDFDVKCPFKKVGR